MRIILFRRYIRYGGKIAGMAGCGKNGRPGVGVAAHVDYGPNRLETRPADNFENQAAS
jgi:hypothetical protein